MFDLVGNIKSKGWYSTYLELNPTVVAELNKKAHEVIDSIIASMVRKIAEEKFNEDRMEKIEKTISETLEMYKANFIANEVNKKWAQLQKDIVKQIK